MKAFIIQEENDDNIIKVFIDRAKAEKFVRDENLKIQAENIEKCSMKSCPNFWGYNKKCEYRDTKGNCLFCRDLGLLGITECDIED